MKFFKKRTPTSLIFQKNLGFYSNSYFDDQIWSSASVVCLTTYRSCYKSDAGLILADYWTSVGNISILTWNNLPDQLL